MQEIMYINALFLQKIGLAQTCVNALIARTLLQPMQKTNILSNAEDELEVDPECSDDDF